MKRVGEETITNDRPITRSRSKSHRDISSVDNVYDLVNIYNRRNHIMTCDDICDTLAKAVSLCASDEFIRRLLTHVESITSNFSNEHIVKTLRALSTCRVNIDDIYPALVKQIRMPITSSMSAKLFHALALVGWYEYSTIDALLKIIGDNVNNLSCHECHVILMSMAYFNVNNRKIVSNLLEIIVKKSGHLDNNQISFVLLSAAVLNADCNPMRQLVITMRERSSKMSEIALKNLYQVYLYALYVACSAELSSTLNDFAYQLEPSRSASEVVTDLQFQLMCFGIKSQPGYCEGLAADLMIGKTPIFVCDPGKYLRASKRPIGSVVLRHRILASMGREVIIVPHFDYNTNMSAEDKRNYILSHFC